MFLREKKPHVGIVVEYNPFHNGHIYQIEQIKKMFPNCKITVAMSYKYSQRGEIIIAPWRVRKKYAKKYGVDKFVKLHTDISAQAAHIFASEAVLKLAKKGINYLVFGSETNDVDLFLKIANLIKNNLDQYNLLIKKYLKQKGNSFPRATNLALSELSGSNITMPNDILGLEYVKTIVNHNLDITPISILRTIDFHSEETNNQFASASKIRSMLVSGEDISHFTPIPREKMTSKNIIDTYKKFQKIVINTQKEKLAKMKMISEGMENLFKKNIHLETYEEFVEACVSKRYTRSRIKRAYLFVLLKKYK